MGYPTSYIPEKHPAEAVRLAKLGLTDQEMANFWGVSKMTVDTWKNKHPEFLEALTIGKQDADSRVAESLYHRAVGYSHDDVDIRTVSVGNGRSEIVQTPIVKHFPPDTTACIFWLKNRQPKLWRDVWRTEVSGPEGGPLEITLRAVEVARRIVAEQRGELQPAPVDIKALPTPDETHE